jgi:capsid protein
MDGLRSDYRAAKETRFQSRLVGVDPAGSGADYHYANEAQFLRLRERARDYQRNDCIVGQAVRRLTANVVKDGFTLDV